ncbi:hypothetical protein M885DRAFT_613524 [Pelagophyceae sp. CCMP2097]|nr:hypothetical protein M885DRAFT_613524 [Pelagophyceae sp. CCMP2097]
MMEAGTTPKQYFLKALVERGMLLEGVTIAPVPFNNPSSKIRCVALKHRAAEDLPHLYDKQLLSLMCDGSVEDIKRQVSSARVANAQNVNGETVLMKVCRRALSTHDPSLGVVALLLESGANPLVCCDSGKNVLHDVFWSAKPPPVEVLKAMERLIALLYEWTGSVGLLELMISADKHGYTPLDYVVPSQQPNWKHVVDTIIGWVSALESLDAGENAAVANDAAEAAAAIVDDAEAAEGAAVVLCRGPCGGAGACSSHEGHDLEGSCGAAAATDVGDVGGAAAAETEAATEAAAAETTSTEAVFAAAAAAADEAEASRLAAAAAAAADEAEASRKAVNENLARVVTEALEFRFADGLNVSAFVGDLDADDVAILEQLCAHRCSCLLSDVADPDAAIVAVSSAFTHETGYEAAEVLGRNCRFLQGPRTSTAHVVAMRAALANHGTARLAVLNYKKAGTPFVNSFLLTPLRRQSDGAVKFYIGVQRCPEHIIIDRRSRLQSRHADEQSNQLESDWWIDDGASIWPMLAEAQQKVEAQQSDAAQHAAVVQQLAAVTQQHAAVAQHEAHNRGPPEDARLSEASPEAAQRRLKRAAPASPAHHGQKRQAASPAPAAADAPREAQGAPDSPRNVSSVSSSSPRKTCLVS